MGEYRSCNMVSKQELCLVGVILSFASTIFWRSLLQTEKKKLLMVMLETTYLVFHHYAINVKTLYVVSNIWHKMVIVTLIYRSHHGQGRRQKISYRLRTEHCNCPSLTKCMWSFPVCLLSSLGVDHKNNWDLVKPLSDKPISSNQTKWKLCRKKRNAA